MSLCQLKFAFSRPFAYFQIVWNARYYLNGPGGRIVWHAILATSNHPRYNRSSKFRVTSANTGQPTVFGGIITPLPVLLTRFSFRAFGLWFSTIHILHEADASVVLNSRTSDAKVAIHLEAFLASLAPNSIFVVAGSGNAYPGGHDETAPPVLCSSC